MVALDRQKSAMQLLNAVVDGPATDEVKSQIFETTYRELQRLGQRMLARQASNHPLQASALVNEAILRLMSGSSLTEISGRQHFFAVTAQTMRCVLVDFARRRTSIRRGGGYVRVSLDVELHAVESEHRIDAIELDEALKQLANLNSAYFELVKLRFHFGMTVDEIARHRQVSKSTIEREWRFVRAWLADVLER